MSITTVPLPTAPVVVRRWCAPRDAGEPARCGCGEPVAIGDRCPQCGEVAAPSGLAGRMTVLTTIAGEPRAVTIERSAGGRWWPASTAPPATPALGIA